MKRSEITNERKKLIENKNYKLNNDINNLTSTLKAQRKKIKMSREKLAEISGISESTIYTIENLQTNFRLLNFLKLLEGVGLELEVIDLPEEEQNIEEDN